MEHLLMSLKERNRMGVLKQVKAKLLSLVAAGKLLRLSYRQAKRVWQRYRDKGDKGLIHRGRGRVGNRRKAATIRARILARYKERYPDFGPTLAAEHLGREGLKVDHETLRQWLLAKGWWTIQRRRQKHRQWRERKACFGELVQMDGSHHDWFEGRRERAVLMVMIDDATNRTYARFSEQETTRAAYDAFEGYVRRHKMPVGLYVDRDSIYRTDREPTVAEQLAGQEPLTQFGRAMKGLGVAIELAYSPQAKGRVERRNGLLQDRLVKELRLAGISDLNGANRFLEEKFLPELNRRFWVKPAQEADAHQQVPRNLAESLNWEEGRVVQRDWTVAWQGRWFQIDSGHEALGDRTATAGRHGATAAGRTKAQVPGIGSATTRRCSAQTRSNRHATSQAQRGPPVATLWNRGRQRVLARSQSASALGPATLPGPSLGLRFAPASLGPGESCEEKSSREQQHKRGHFLLS